MEEIVIKPEEIEYTIADDLFGEFHVRKTANAWWKNRSKVGKLIGAFKLGCTIQEAQAHSGITKDQWSYFNEQHPEFSEIKEVCLNSPNIKARQTIVNSLEDPKMARWYAERKMKDEFAARTELTGKNGNKIETESTVVGSDDFVKWQKSQHDKQAKDEYPVDPE